MQSKMVYGIEVGEKKIDSKEEAGHRGKFRNHKTK
jgi:hypothetical protein